MQKVQDNFFKKAFQVSPNGTPTCMIRLDSKTLHIRWNEKNQTDTQNHGQKTKLIYSFAWQNTCAREDLLNECKAWCKKLNIRCVTRGTDPIPENARADDFKLKQALWRENDKEIRSEMDQKDKVRDIIMPKKKLKETTLQT